MILQKCSAYERSCGMLLDFFTGLIYCQNEASPLFLYFSFYNHILDALISPNRTQQNIIVYEEIRSKMNIVQEVHLSINDRISVRAITAFYNRNVEPSDRISPLTSAPISHRLILTTA